MPFDVTAAPATQLVITTQPPGSVTAGQSFGMTVTAEDQFGNTDMGYSGTVAITSPSIINSGGPVTVMNGVAIFPNLSIDTVGTYKLKAVSTGLTSVTSTSVMVNPGPAAMLVWVTEPTTPDVHGVGFFGGTLDVEDQYMNVETGFTGLVTVLDANPGNAMLTGGVSATAMAGVVSFPGLVINNVADGYTLVATGDDVSSPDSTPVNVTLFPPVGLEVTTQPPATVQVAQTFGLTVTVLDGSNLPDPDFNGNVTVSSPTNTLSGTTTVAAIGGVATFSGLSLADVGTVTLQISSVDGLATTTNSINVTAGPASQLILVTEPPSSLSAGVCLASRSRRKTVR